MKTLDEVTKANECCDHGEMDSRCEDCPYSGIGACCRERETDTLHYLKKYRDEDKKLGRAINEACDVEMQYYKLIEDFERNEPLDWDELQQMNGKPVWMERPEWKEWLLISEIDKDKCEIYLRDKWGNGVSVNARNIGYWQAYRKERG